MKKLALFIVSCFYASATFSQDNPYAEFGYKPKIILKDYKEDIFRVKNIDTGSDVKYFEINFQKHIVNLFNKRDVIIRQISIEDGDLLRFISLDPLTKKYPELTPYQFASNSPIHEIDLDGLEGVVIGGADLSNTGVSETIKKITTTVQGNLKAAKIDIPVESFNVPRSDTKLSDIRSTSVYKNALTFIKANYKADKPLVLYGYSYGGAVVDALQTDLFKAGYKVNTMVLVDANRGKITELHPMIMSNVKDAYNFYQDNYNIVGSRGFTAEKTFSKSPTVLNNYDISKTVPLQPGMIPKWFPFFQSTNKHSNMDEATMQIAISLMTNGLKN
jgi:hypothetical protein